MALNKEWLKEFIDVYGIPILLLIVGAVVMYLFGAFDDITFFPKINETNATFNTTR